MKKSQTRWGRRLSVHPVAEQGALRAEVSVGGTEWGTDKKEKGKGLHRETGSHTLISLGVTIWQNWKGCYSLCIWAHNQKKIRDKNWLCKHWDLLQTEFIPSSTDIDLNFLDWNPMVYFQRAFQLHFQRGKMKKRHAEAIVVPAACTNSLPPLKNNNVLVGIYSHYCVYYCITWIIPSKLFLEWLKERQSSLWQQTGHRDFSLSSSAPSPPPPIPCLQFQLFLVIISKCANDAVGMVNVLFSQDLQPWACECCCEHWWLKTEVFN